MGASYYLTGPHRGKLCCDRCDGRGIKRPCPWGQCPAVAYCARCWRDPSVRGAVERYHVEAECEAAAGRTARAMKPSASLDALLERARQHGEESEAEHEVGDLRTLARLCWERLDVAGREAVTRSFAELADPPTNPV